MRIEARSQHQGKETEVLYEKATRVGVMSMEPSTWIGSPLVSRRVWWCSSFCLLIYLSPGYACIVAEPSFQEFPHWNKES